MNRAQVILNTYLYYALFATNHSLAGSSGSLFQVRYPVSEDLFLRTLPPDHGVLFFCDVCKNTPPPPKIPWDLISRCLPLNSRNSSLIRLGRTFVLWSTLIFHGHVVLLEKLILDVSLLKTSLLSYPYLLWRRRPPEGGTMVSISCYSIILMRESNAFFLGILLICHYSFVLTIASSYRYTSLAPMYLNFV